MVDVIIESAVVPTHRPRGVIEAWQYTGQPVEEWPDWLRAHYQYRPGGIAVKARTGNWALRDEEGYFWKWLHRDIFERTYEPIAPRS